MGAEIGLEIDVARLVERADEVRRLEGELGDRRRRTGVRAEIARAQIVRGKEWLAAGEVDQDVAAGGEPIAHAAEAPFAAGRGRGLSVAVDRDLESAEPAARLPGAAAADREFGAARRHHALEGGEDQRHVEARGELRCQIERLLPPPGSGRRRSLVSVTAPASLTVTCAAASSAAIFGPAFAPSLDQPAASRMLAKDNEA